jgi:hypothetical protein
MADVRTTSFLECYQGTVDGSNANTKRSSDVLDGNAVLVHSESTATVEDHTTPTQLLAPMLGALDSGQDTLSDQFPFEFCHGCEYVKQQTCRRVCLVGVNRLGNCKEPDPIRSQGFDAIQAISNRTSEAVKFPNEHSIKAS